MSEFKQSQIAHIRREAENKFETKPLDHTIFARIFSYAKPYAAKRNALFVLVSIRAIQLLLTTWILGGIINGPITNGDIKGTFLSVGGLTIFIIITQIVFHYRTKLALEIGELVIHDLRRDMFSRLMTMNMGFFTRTRLGRILSRFTSDSEAVRNGIQNVVFISMVQGGTMVIASVIMLFYDWQLFLIMMAIGPIIWGINRYFRLKLINAYRAVQESFSRVTASVVESIKGIRIIQGYVRQDFNSEVFRELLNDHSTYNVRVAETESIFLPLLELNSQIFLSILLVVGGCRVINHSLDIATLIQFFFLSNFFFAPIQSIAGQYNMALTAMAGAERVFQFLDQKPDWEDTPDAVDINKIKGKVEFENVNFGYKPETPVLKDINFSVKAGQTVALVGHTGSGKTTITSLISKFYLPDTGGVFIDERNINDIKTKSLRRHLGIVLQSNFLFTGTVMENILLGKEGASEKDAIDAVKQLDCLDIIESLPDGFKTKVGENGVGLSLGQRQIICFSRAMLADPAILILDEATSSVDAITEEKIQVALSKLLKNRTSFVVAHRLSVIKNADLVLVMKDGEIAERGTHKHLLELKGTYARLYREFQIAHEL